MLTRLLPRTLRSRLTALIFLSTSVVLALSGVALYEALRSRIDSTSLEQMDSTMSALKTHMAQFQSTAEVAGNTELWLDQLHGHESMDLAIFDMADQALLTTVGFQPYAPLLTVTGAAPVLIAPRATRYRYLVAVVPLQGGTSLRVMIQYDRTRDIALLRAHAWTIVLIEVSGVILAAALAYGIALVGLSPLRRLARRAEKMSSSRLAQPLPELDTAGELKELEHAFNGMQQRLHESFSRLSQFSSNLAHDMRTPLTNLQAAAQVALSAPRSSGEYREVIESSIDEYQRLSRMVEDMLFLARAENADTLVAVKTIDAFAEAQQVAGFYESMAADVDVLIEVRGSAHVQADLLLFQRALSNLLSNALAHAPRGSTVFIECGESEDGVTIAVTDSGAGIQPQHAARIFERFYRVDPSRSNSASGTGLGLAIVKSIMSSHGGQCGVDSQPGVRTTFWLRFPRGARAGRAPGVREDV
ncbi:two-component sensor histidine kinase [Burkholderia sp. SRS-W-2-2016]|uniref:heavy metal sensor histidine kinase n=1 Tax=Burkholderia sp. SRS-W-2-2016 TaxID=1926878 RepID=UPI00094AC6BC|nr:heavy metal sensor histidine kinase [Burkholderia sp. SRS-W-2-2016]OLL32114.1 two-component sensor histidine kinase [Burkholderia sp. SRS-W-2-2016]